MSVRFVTKNVNSRRLFEEIHGTLFDAVTTLGVKWTSESHRNNFIEVIEDYFMDLVEQGKIQQFKVICDHRNNKGGFTTANTFKLDLEFRQPHCLNITSITYFVPKK